MVVCEKRTWDGGQEVVCSRWSAAGSPDGTHSKAIPATKPIRVTRAREAQARHSAVSQQSRGKDS